MLGHRRVSGPRCALPACRVYFISFLLIGTLSTWPLVLLPGGLTCPLLLLQKCCLFCRHPLLLLLQQLLNSTSLRQHQPHVLQHILDIRSHFCLRPLGTESKQKTVDEEPGVLQEDPPGALFLSSSSAYIHFQKCLQNRMMRRREFFLWFCTALWHGVVIFFGWVRVSIYSEAKGGRANKKSKFSSSSGALRQAAWA